jgi:hypothetical protein
MAHLPIEQQVLLALEIAALVALCLRLWVGGLYRNYPYFFGYLVLEFAQALIPVLVPLESRLYRDLFVASEAAIVVFYVLVVLELYSKILWDMPGISRLAHRFVRLVMLLATILALLPFALEKNTSTLTGYVFLFERVVMSALVVFLLLIGVFLLYYPVPLGRNVIVYLSGYAVAFLTAATVTLINNLGYFWNRLLGEMNMCIFVGCLMFWFFMLSRAGEDRRVVVGHQWNPGADQRLLAQLDAINASLSGSRGK